MKKAILVLFLGLLLLSAIVGAYIGVIIRSLPKIWEWLFWFATIISLLYQYNLRFYQFITKCWMALNNEQIRWSYKVVIKGGFGHQVYTNWKETLRNNMKDVFIIKEKSLLDIINADGIIIETRYEEYSDEDANESASLTIYIQDYLAAYNQSKECLFERIMPMISNFKTSVLNGVMTGEEYVLIARFNKVNRFLGPYITKLTHQEICSFNCIMIDAYPEIGTDVKSIIEITREYLKFSSSKEIPIKKSAEKYLLI